MKARALLAACLIAAAGPALAQKTIYRCGSAGNVVYSQTPCPEGRVVEATDPRTAAQRAQARKVAADERRQAAEMARDRRQQEAKDRQKDKAHEKAVAAASKPSASAAAKSRPLKFKPARSAASGAGKA